MHGDDDDDATEEATAWSPELGFQQPVPTNLYSFPRPVTGKTRTTVIQHKVTFTHYNTFDRVACDYPGPQGYGLSYGVRVVLNASTSERYCSFEGNTGFQVQVHKPHEHPQPRTYGHWIQDAHETRLFVEPNVLKTTEMIKDIPMDTRRCIFQDESPLKFFGYGGDIN